MRTGTIQALLVAAFLTFSTTAAANGFLAIEGSAITLVNGNESGRSDELTPGGLRFRLGTPIGRLLDLEGHLGFSFDDDNDKFDDISATYYGAYLKAYLPIGHSSALFALSGLTNVNLDQSVGTSELSDNRVGVSFGFGLETQLTENADLTADYMSYLRDEGLFEEISSFNFGIKLYF